MDLSLLKIIQKNNYLLNLSILDSINISRKIVFNHYYRLRHDTKRSILYSLDNNPADISIDVNLSWLSKIHPVYAMLFSLLSKPITMGALLNEIVYFFGVNKMEAENIITPFLDKKAPFYIIYAGAKNYFPKNIVIDADDAETKTEGYIPSQFSYKEVDLKQERFISAPLSIVFMVNNHCMTDCIYCYADKQTKSENLSFGRLSQIIINAKEIGISSFIVTGGEFFLYDQWKELIEILAKNGYTPGLISTKIPVITEKQISILKKYNITLQISLDSVDDQILKEILNVKSGYAEMVKNSILRLEKNQIFFQIATVLTCYNGNIKNLEKIYAFLKELKKLKRWEIRLAFRSLYGKRDFNEIKINKEHIGIVDQWIKKVQKEGIVNISWDITGIDRYFKSKNGSKNFIGSRCSANYSNIFILPDGQVSLCEQLYWTPEYIIGDMKVQSIKEVWNSPRALELANPVQENFKENSPCKNCKIFDECYSFPNKCIVDVLKGYGSENRDYPDPRCIDAPVFIHDLNY